MNIGDPWNRPQIVGSPYNEVPNKVPPKFGNTDVGSSNGNSKLLLSPLFAGSGGDFGASPLFWETPPLISKFCSFWVTALISDFKVSFWDVPPYTSSPS